MYAKFKLNELKFLDELNSIKKEEYKQEGENIFKRNLGIVRKKLEEYLSPTGKLKMTEIQEDWFPEIKADIFLSHSHQDEQKALILAGYLKKKFGLVTFIDSLVWGNFLDLLKEIDEKYNKQENGSYNYKKSTRASVNVNLTLMMALTKMLDRCECAFFLGSPNSISISESSSENVTNSPWIYSEIEILNVIQSRKPERIKGLQEFSGVQNSVSFNPEYEVNLKEFKELDNETFTKWTNQKSQLPQDALDFLYKITEISYRKKDKFTYF